MTDRHVFSVRLDEDIEAHLRLLARARGSAIGELIRRALRIVYGTPPLDDEAMDQAEETDRV
jgi:hypothetical protein